jgi:hypothetical protein
LKQVKKKKKKEMQEATHNATAKSPIEKDHHRNIWDETWSKRRDEILGIVCSTNNESLRRDLEVALQAEEHYFRDAHAHFLQQHHDGEEQFQRWMDGVVWILRQPNFIRWFVEGVLLGPRTMTQYSALLAEREGHFLFRISTSFVRLITTCAIVDGSLQRYSIAEADMVPNGQRSFTASQCIAVYVNLFMPKFTHIVLRSGSAIEKAKFFPSTGYASVQQDDYFWIRSTRDYI